MSQQAVFPTKFFGKFMSADGGKIVTPRVKKLRVQQIGSVVCRRRLAGTKTIIYADKRLLFVVFPHAPVLVKHVDKGKISPRKQVLGVRNGNKLK